MLAENPKITELKPYKGFQIFKYQTFSEWSSYIHYVALRSRFGYVEDYIEESTLKDCKRKIDSLLQEEEYEMIKDGEKYRK